MHFFFQEWCWRLLTWADHCHWGDELCRNLTREVTSMNIGYHGFFKPQINTVKNRHLALPQCTSFFFLIWKYKFFFVFILLLLKVLPCTSTSLPLCLYFLFLFIFLSLFDLSILLLSKVQWLQTYCKSLLPCSRWHCYLV